MKAGAPKVVFNLDEEKLRRAGLERTQVAGTIDAALRGRVGGELLEDTERLPVRARLNRSEWNDVNALSSLRIALPHANGNNSVSAVPLLSLGHVELLPDDSPISREDGERLNRVQGFLTRGVLPEEALKLLQKDLRDNPIPLPTGYRYSFGGDSDERAQVVNDLLAPMGMIISGLIATVLLTFNSWRLTAVALLVCGCSFGLSFLALAIFRYPLGIQALIGVIGSIGVSINAAIIILTALQQDTGAARGDLIAIRNVVLDSSRHIVSTTVTTFGGFLPLILEGSQFWPPFAMAIAGGVLLSTIISFYLVPPLFLVTLSRRREELGMTTHPRVSA
jgi:multidrug efflux pump subunit AcrB